MKHQEFAKVLENKKIAPEHYRLTLISPKIAKEAVPGQFIMIKCSDGYDPLLRRPISLHDIDRSKNTIDILFRVIGKGTRMLSEIEPGEDLDIIGPLGNGFKIDTSKDIAVLIGGGVGIAPLLALAKDMKSKEKGIYALIGANNISQVLCEEEFKSLGCETLVTTDDGTFGKKGLITDILIDLLDSTVADKHVEIYACGPRPMVKALEDLTIEYKVPCQVSLEEWMACGIGTCNGCTVMTKNGYKKVCSDGPVFDIKELIWQK